MVATIKVLNKCHNNSKMNFEQYKYLMNEEERQKLAAILKELQGNLSQRQFAKILQISSFAMRSWIECESVPTRENLEKIAKYMGITLDQLLAKLRDQETVASTPNYAKAEQLLPLVDQLPKAEIFKLTRYLVDRLEKVAVN